MNKLRLKGNGTNFIKISLFHYVSMLRASSKLCFVVANAGVGKKSRSVVRDGESYLVGH